MEVAIINDVVLEGIVVRTWKYADDLLFRLACYRDPDLPQKALNEVQDGSRKVTGTRLWTERLEAQKNNCDIEANSGQISTGVEILLKMSHNTLTSAEEHIQW